MEKQALPPLSGRVYYLDVKPSKRHLLLRKNLLKLGAQVEEFLSKDVKYLITDRTDGSTNDASKVYPDGETWHPDTPISGIPSPIPIMRFPMDQDFQFPESPLTDSMKIQPTPIQNSVQSRGQALLERAVKHKIQKSGSADVLEVSRQWGIKIIPLRSFLDFIEKTLKKAAQKSVLNKSPLRKKSPGKPFRCVQFKGPFIKIQDLKGDNRPFYKQLELEPDIYFDHPCKDPLLPKLKEDEKTIEMQQPKLSSIHSQREGYSVGLAAKAKDLLKENIQQVRKPANQKAKMGYCEICGQNYPNFFKHVQSKVHSTFMLNEANYKSLKQLVWEIPTTLILRDSKRSLANLSNQCQSELSSNLRETKRPKVSAESSNSPLKKKNPSSSCAMKRPKSEPLFSEEENNSSEAEFVEASCTTSPENQLLLVKKDKYLKRLITHLDSSSEIFDITRSPKDKKRVVFPNSSGTPPRHGLQEYQETCLPPIAHQASSNRHNVTPEVEPLNLCLKRSPVEDTSSKIENEESSVYKDCKRRSENLFFSENARISPLGKSGNTSATKPDRDSVHFQGATTTKDGNTALCFSNMQFEIFSASIKDVKPIKTDGLPLMPTLSVQKDKPFSTTIVEQSVMPSLSIQKDEGFSTGTTTNNLPTDNSISPIDLEAAGILAVRKALFMSEASSPLKMCKSFGALDPVIEHLFDSGQDEPFSRFSLSEKSSSYVQSASVFIESSGLKQDSMTDAASATSQDHGVSVPGVI